MYAGKKILLGVSGGIAAYKACELVRHFIKQGAEVRVIMTRSACEFVTPLTFETLSQQHVTTETFPAYDASISGTHHIEIARWPDIFLIAPATANVIGKIANGIADDILSTVAMACPAPILVAPAMNDQMWASPFVQRNVKELKSNKIEIIDPEFGYLAEGYDGSGRLAELSKICWRVDRILFRSEELSGKRVLVTAGPTHEALDPVRYITNASSGRMGFAVARQAVLMGAHVTLISGPTSLPEPFDVTCHHVTTAQEMAAMTEKQFPEHDVLVMTAAVADFMPSSAAVHKIKKSGNSLRLDLKPTVDILGSLGGKKGNRIVVGFALETEKEIEHARQKLVEKNLDFIVVNNPRREGAGFHTDTNIVSFVERKKVTDLPLLPKDDVARQILERAAVMLMENG
jgi:phosphopantothenoylcysteine decarboxylase/phosphopantothenate--cysteine ligase